MTITPQQLRQALGELNGERSLRVVFVDVTHPQHELVHIANAMLIPDEADHLVKVTDGKAIYIIDAERVALVTIGPV